MNPILFLHVVIMFLRWSRSKVVRFIALFTLPLVLITQVWSQPVGATGIAELVGELLTELESRTGYTLSRDVLISNTTEDRERFLGSDADSVYARAVQVVSDGAGGWRDAIEARGGIGLASSWDACLIIYTDRLVRMADPRDQRMALAHELAHCYQYDRMGDLRALPDWLREGSAEWMGQTIANSPNFGRVRWGRYLTETHSLYSRSYDAMGFFSHIAYQGVDVWNLLDRYFSDPALPLLSDQMFDHLLSLSGSRDRILQTWPMSLERNTGAGRDWDTNGPAITGDRRGTTTLSVPGSQALAIATQYLLSFTIPNRQIVTVSVNQGHGAIRWDRDTETFNGSFNKRYCLGDSCQCEDGSSPSGVESVRTANALLAATADNTPGSVTISMEEPPCEPEDPEPSSGSGTGDGDRATGTSYGDPHIITYDGYRYSFQTVGEFLLSKTVDGHFEVQARQAQVPGRELSLNTAAAMRVGNQRVAVYAQGAPDGQSSLWVDGQPVSLQRGQFDLAQGGFVRKTGDLSYQVHWPTGEIVTLNEINVGNASFLNITPSVPRSEARQFMGLLGDLNANPGDDLKTRGGQVIPSQDAYAPVTQLINRVIDLPIPLNNVQNAFFQQLYRQFGDSWRISQGESLFDYGPGQTTETFTNRAFPSQFPSLMGVAPSQIQSATRLCQESGVTGQFLEGCVFDVAATGQPNFAQAALDAVATTVVNAVTERVVDQVRNEIEEALPIPIPLPGWPF